MNEYMPPTSPFLFYMTHHDINNIATILNFPFAGEAPDTIAEGIHYGLAIAAATLHLSPENASEPHRDVDMVPCEPYLEIPLCGRHGGGKIMLIDKSDWEAGIAAGWPSDFGLTWNRNARRFYVTSTRPPVSNTGNAAPLARLVLDAPPGGCVFYRNGDTLDLRRSNLMKLSRAEFARLRRGAGQLQPFRALT